MSLLDHIRKNYFPGLWQGKGFARTERPVGEIFKSFRRVLGANNNALEIITDMGEKLSGDFIFDRRYIETILDELNQALLSSIAAINELSQDRMQGLYPIFNTLRNRVKSIQDGNFNFAGQPIIWLHEMRPWHYLEVGAKSANLAELSRNPQIMVPPGFAITTHVFFDIIVAAGLKQLLDDFESALSTKESDDGEVEKLRQEIEGRVLEVKVPAYLPGALNLAINQLIEKTGRPVTLAVRSSALEEDMEFTFAGQFLSVMNVPANAEEIFRAYRQVLASFFSKSAIFYRKLIFPEGSAPSMAVLCQQMIDSTASGVIYTADPVKPHSNSMIVVGSLGQGQPIVEGQVPSDFFRLSHQKPPQILEKILAAKKEKSETGDQSGIFQCVNDEMLFQISEAGIILENFFKRPQDIEWTVDSDRNLFILQARPLRIIQESEDIRPLNDILRKYTLVSKDRGHVAQHGIASGRVHRAETLADINDFPDLAVLVSRRDSSQFAQIMHKVAAIITEIGTPISHMATLCREFGVPCIVGLEGIMSEVENGEEITVDAEDRTIYRGRVEELLEYRAASALNLGNVYEFRLLRKIVREVSRLDFVDPLMQNFSMAECRSYHDILRFIHEKAVLELVELGKDDQKVFVNQITRPLDLPIPAGIMVVDIGNGIKEHANQKRIGLDDIHSTPFAAILKGMLHPGVWHDTSMTVGFRDLMNSILTVPTDLLSGQFTGHNVAIISENYVNLCFRFGYHFNIIDAYSHDIERNNHIYFRFLGGATDITKRSRRADLISRILKSFDFNIQIKGDLVIARIHNLFKSEIERILEMLGRLVGFTRQLDVKLTDDIIVGRYADAFLREDYSIISS